MSDMTVWVWRISISGCTRLAMTPPVRPHRDAGVGELGRDLLQQDVGLSPGVAHRERLCRKEFLRLVDHVVELDERASVVLAEEENVDGREQLLRARQVEPELCLVEPGDRGEGLPFLGFAELDVDPPPVRQPAGHGGFAAEAGIRVLDAAVVLRPELILRRSAVPGRAATRRRR